MASNNTKDGFSMRRHLEDQGVTLESETFRHMQNAVALIRVGKIKSFAQYKVVG